jgi:hypothetical protein
LVLVEGWTSSDTEKETADTPAAGNVEASTPTTRYIYIYIERESERKVWMKMMSLD